MAKKILVVDDSALMRRVICDIINSDERFQVTGRAVDGLQAFDLLSRHSYDAVVLDVNMPRMTGLELLKELRKYRIPARVMMASTDRIICSASWMRCQAAVYPFWRQSRQRAGRAPRRLPR